MKKWLEIEGTLVFDIENKTKKHEKQSSWKRTVIALFKDDLSEYYSWFIKKRYNVSLNKPLRGSHYTIVNDRSSEISNWDETKSTYDGKKIKIYYSPDVRSNIEHWWLKSFSIQGNLIRNKLGLGWPYFNPHITLGLVNEKNIEASKYALRCEERFSNDFQKLVFPEIAYKYLK